MFKERAGPSQAPCPGSITSRCSENEPALRIEPNGGRFLFRKKTENFGGSNVEFPIGKKLFHLVVNPVTSRCPTVDLELVQTTRNVLMKHEIPFGNSKRENGPTFLDFPLFLGIFQWDEPTKRVPFTAEPEIPEILTKWKEFTGSLDYEQSLLFLGPSSKTPVTRK